MPRIRCHYIDCVFLDEGFCISGSIELDPDEGCVTYTLSGSILDDDDLDGTDDDNWEELGFGEEDDEWLDEAEFG
jgi:hypothetical protein